MERVIFIIGGARSGKSSLALEMASACKGSKVYLATAEPLDSEMRERIERHRKVRSSEWHTIEEPRRISSSIKELSSKYNIILLDCLTLWLSNLLIRRQTIERELEDFLDTIKVLKDSSTCSLFIVSNEVGMGIVPDNEISRRFRDLSGYLNQRVAEVADDVYLVTAGIPLKIK